jgi:hypothetical protein
VGAGLWGSTLGKDENIVRLHLHHPAHVWDVEATSRDVCCQQAACMASTAALV